MGELLLLSEGLADPEVGASPSVDASVVVLLFDSAQATKKIRAKIKWIRFIA